jgi:chitodextrinase
VTTLARSASVRIGSYSLEVGPSAVSFAQFEPGQEFENAQELKGALAEEPDDRPTAVAAIEEFQESADAVTGRIEQADKLLRDAAAGKLLDLGNITGEVDGLLDLFGRLDKAGRFDEELKLMRSLNGLLALTLRWLDLVRSLRSLLRSAQAAGHAAGQAWAHHELGSLHLCAGAAEKASQHLHQALRFEEQLGDLAGRCASRHNLDSARRDLALPARGRRPRRRLLRSAALATAFVLLGGGGTGIAFAIHGRHGGSTPTQPGTHSVTVKLAGSGNGSVRGAGVACPNDCVTSVEDGSSLTLEATAGAASLFVRWDGVDCGRRACALVVTDDVTATAVFERRADTQPPTTPTGLRATVASASEIDLSWLASSDNVGVTGYVIYRDGAKLTTIPGSKTAFQDTGLAASTAYVYSVQAIDAAGNASEQSSRTKAKTPAAPDTEAPSTPADLTATAISASEIDLSWSASTDNVAVTGYVIYRDGAKLTTVSGTTTTFQDTALEASTGYVYTVQAIDAAGNASAQSNRTKAKTGPG